MTDNLAFWFLVAPFGAIIWVVAILLAALAVKLLFD